MYFIAVFLEVIILLLVIDWPTLTQENYFERSGEHNTSKFDLTNTLNSSNLPDGSGGKS